MPDETPTLNMGGNPSFSLPSELFALPVAQEVAPPVETPPASTGDAEPAKAETPLAAQPDANTPASDAVKGETAKVTEPVAEPENVPWHKDPRFQKFQEDQRQLEAQKPLLDFARKIEAEWGSIEAYNKAIADSVAASQQAEASNAEAEVWAEAQGFVDREEMSESVATRYAQNKIEALQAKRDAEATKAQLAAFQPTLQGLQAQQAQAALEAHVQEQFTALQSQYPHMDPDAVYAALYNGVKNPEGFAQRSHERIVSETKRIEEAAEAKYTAQLKQIRGATPVPMGSNPGMAPAGQAAFDPEKPMSIYEALMATSRR